MPPAVHRGEIWWARLPSPTGSGPGYRRPVLVIQSDVFNESAIGTVVVASITSNTNLARSPGNVLLDAALTGLQKDSVVNVSQLGTMDRRILTAHITSLPDELMDRVSAGIRVVLAV